MSELDRLLRDSARSRWRAAAFLIMLGLSALIGWAAFAELDQVAVAIGEVKPKDKVKVIQHLEGGIIKEIFIEEGRYVRAGEPLVELILPTTAMNKSELEVRLAGERLTLARLAAEIAERDLVLPEAEAEAHPDLAQAEEKAFLARREEQQSTLILLGEQARQRSFRIQELEASERAHKADLRLARQNLAISSDLLRDRLTSKLEHVERQREVQRLEGELATIAAAIPRARAALAEAKEKLRETDTGFEREALEEAREAELEIASIRELLAEASVQAQRTVIRSPTDGVVKNLRYVTLGGVVRPGEPIMELVPSHNNLVIEARLKPTDRGYVREGQPARAKISTYDYIRYGALEGSIVQISPDSTVDAEGNAFFRVVMAPERTYLGASPEDLPIMPGMEAEVDIKVDRKSILASILEPILKIREEAFRERL